MSVIIPAYNSSATIERIANEVLHQTFMPSELIIVDDGSTDSTLNIAKKIQEQNAPIVIVIHQPNKGVSAARNAGIKASQSRYITFIDSDDEISEDYLENLMSGIIEDNSDLSIAGYHKVPTGDVMLKKAVFDKSRYRDVLMTYNIGVAVCKVYDADIIRQNKIEFPVGMKASEDAVFYYRYLQHSKRCSFVDKSGYTYYAPADGKTYGISVPDELIALEAMSQTIIKLLNTLVLDSECTERLRKRIVIILHRVLIATYSLPRQTRSDFLSKVQWYYLLPYLKTDSLTRFLLHNRYFTIFYLLMILRGKILRRQYTEILK